MGQWTSKEEASAGTQEARATCSFADGHEGGCNLPNLNSNDPPAPTRTRRTQREKKQQKRKRRYQKAMRAFFTTLGIVIILLGASIGVGFFTPFGTNIRLGLAETIISTRHFTWARYLTTPHEYARLMKALDGIAVGQSNPKKIDVSVPKPVTHPVPVVQIIPLHEYGYTGDVMLVHNPRLVRLVPAKVVGDEGEYITDMATRVGALAGTNASGFEDPNGEGWGGIPVGLEYVNGQVKQASKDDPSWATVGFTNSGVMVMGNYSLSQLSSLGVRDAMQFHPELVVNGQPTITQGDGGWGYGPRTAIGQAADGTVIFVVINGRLSGGSIGASQRQVMDIMLRYHAVNACAMDGGSSSVLEQSGKILNSPSTIDPNGQRHLPDAWLVFSTEQAANAING